MEKQTIRWAAADANFAKGPPAGSQAPTPDPTGRFLLIMHDPHAAGGLWMRRYASKEDALAVACNYTGADRTWLFEVAQEFDMDAEHEAFWARIGFGAVA